MKNKKFREITVSGSEYEMGLQIGEECKDEIKDLVGITLQRFNLSSKKNISLNQVTNLVKKIIYCSKDFLDDEFNELKGISRSSNVKFEDLMILNCRNMFGAVSEGCTTVLISSERSSEKSSIAGQNWDNDPLMMDFSIVLTRKPNYKPNNTTWTQPGLSAYMGINSEGTAICMNALNGPVSTAGIPWYFIVRKIFGTKGFEEINNILKNITPAITANAAIVTNEGPVNYELTPKKIRYIEPEEGLIVHTNHCVHNDLVFNNIEFKDNIYGQSFERKTRSENILSEIKSVTLDNVKSILSDHDGFPTSICRHQNSDKFTGWQKSVISIIMLPELGQLHISAGNPCENEYEVYLLK